MTNQVLFANNAVSLLAVGISASDTTVTVATGKGALYPSPVSGQFFVATLYDSTNMEVVWCTARSGDSLTIARAKEGTTARAWTTSAYIELRLTKATMELLPQLEKTNSFTETNSFAGQTLMQQAPNYAGLSTGAADVYAVTFTPALGAPTAGMDIRFRAHQTNTAVNPTFSINGSAPEQIYSTAGTA